MRKTPFFWIFQLKFRRRDAIDAPLAIDLQRLAVGASNFQSALWYLLGLNFGLPLPKA